MIRILRKPSAAVLFLTLFVTGAHNVAAQEARRQKPEQPQKRNQYRDQADPMLQDEQQKDTQSFAGTISLKHGKFYLEQEFHKATFELTDFWEAKRFVGQKVRITGVVLNPEKDILRVIAITAVPGPQPPPREQPSCPAPPCH